LVHVAVKDLKCGDVERTPTPSWDFTVLNSSEFVILLPQIGLEDLSGRQKPENGRVSFCELSTLLVLLAEERNPMGEQSGATVAAPVATTPFLKNDRRFVCSPAEIGWTRYFINPSLKTIFNRSQSARRGTQ